MKPWRDLSEVQWPARVQALPLDERGYPIPATVAWLGGKPDFRVIDPNKWAEHALQCRCGICGQELVNDMVFVGGPQSAAHGGYTDLPMHEDCATFALQVCPFLAIPKMTYRQTDPEGCVSMVPKMEKPDFLVMVHASGYMIIDQPGVMMLQAFDLHTATPWREGRILELEELIPYLEKKIHERFPDPTPEKPQPPLQRMPL